MKKITKILGFITLSVIIGFGMLACDEGGNNNNNNGGNTGGNNGGGDNTPSCPNFGSITFYNIPEGFFNQECFINGDPTYSDWIAIPFANNVGKHFNRDSFYPGIIGQVSGTTPVSSTRSITLPIYSSTPSNQNGVWSANPSFTSDFSFNGYASVFVRFITNEDFGDVKLHHYVGLNNVQFSNGHAVIDYAAAFFQLPPTVGEFTLTEASEFNNKYAILVGAIDSNSAIYGFSDATSATALKGFKIENGEVKIPVWKLNIASAQFESYNGNDAITALIILILDTEVFDTLHYAANTSSYKYITYMTGYNPVTFSSGKASRTVSQGLSFGF